jgi:ABC-type glycerol-3-phosphate transport system permease component
MPIISSIQHKSREGRLLVGAMYVLLTLGAVWMVYPFLLLLSGSVKSEVDVRQFDVFPKYLTDDLTLFRKFEAQRYSDLPSNCEASIRSPLYSFEHLEKPNPLPPSVLEDWNHFLENYKSWPRHFFVLGHNAGYQTVSELTLEFKKRLAKEFPHKPKNQLFPEGRGESIKLEDWSRRVYQERQDSEVAHVYYKMRDELPLRYFYPNSIERSYLSFLAPKIGTDKEMEANNRAWGTNYKSRFDINLPRSAPSNQAQRDTWWSFISTYLSARFIEFDPSLLPQFQDFLRSKYSDLSKLNTAYGTSYKNWRDIPFPKETTTGFAMQDIEDGFLQTLKSPHGVSLRGIDFKWRDYLKQKYKGDLAAFNQAHGSHYASFEEARMPIFQHEWELMQKHRTAIVGEMFSRNYRIVWNYLSNQSRAIPNTLIFCLLNVLTALIVNPLAAYALSRFQPRWGYKAMFFLLATMAFPAEVTQIPSFLLLRELGWLNTFLALIIPAAAHGYHIFLLKGFFDSLPQDLYESASLDGASELRIFFTITIPLSAPILAVTALHAFTQAYGAFMFALLVCQKESMWTLMVYIYQIQQLYNTPVIFASLVIAAVPTLLVFVFCQNIIMRGIVVPVEK